MEDRDSIDAKPSSPDEAEYLYRCFISYRQADNRVADRQWASWLQQSLERYQIPSDLIGQKNSRNEVIPDRIYPVFRDEESLPAHANLAEPIKEALRNSQFLIVLCSPRAVESRYVRDEISYFIQHGGSNRILPVIIAGEPGDPERECFPEPLRQIEDGGGMSSGPLAADFRLTDGEEGFTSANRLRTFLKREKGLGDKEAAELSSDYGERLHLMKLKVIAGLLGITLDRLRDRDQLYQLELAKRRGRSLARWLWTASILFLAAVVGGVLTYRFYNQAATERDQAEKILEFMTFQVRDRLDPYVPAALRNEMLSQVEEYYRSTGRTRRGEALNTLATHYQSLGDLASTIGDTRAALEGFQENHRRLLQLVKEEPDNVQWRVNLGRSQEDLAEILYTRGDTEQALKYCEDALRSFGQVREVDPEQPGHRIDLARTSILLGKLKAKTGAIDEGRGLVEESVRTLRELKEDPLVGERARDAALFAEEALVGFLQSTGEFAKGLEVANRVISARELAIEGDPSNKFHLRSIAFLYRIRGVLKIDLGMPAEGELDLEKGLETVRTLSSLDASDTGNREFLARYHIDLAWFFRERRQLERAIREGETGVEILEALSESDPANFSRRVALAMAHKELGDAFRDAGRKTESAHHYERLLSIAREAHHRDRDNLEYLYLLSLGHEKVGDAFLAEDNEEEARKHFDNSLVLRERLVKEDPEEFSYRRDLSVSIERMGELTLRDGDFEKARQWFDRSIAERSASCERNPRSLSLRRELCVPLVRSGRSALKMGDVKAAEALFLRQREIAGALVREDPGNLLFLGDLCLAVEGLRDTARAGEDFESAANLAREAVDLRKRFEKQVDAGHQANRFPKGQACYAVANGWVEWAEIEGRLGRIESSVEKYREAADSYRSAIDAGTEEADYFRGYWFAIDRMHETGGEEWPGTSFEAEYEKALLALDKAISSSGGRVDFRHDAWRANEKFAKFLWEQGRREEAIPFYEKEVQILESLVAPDSAQSHRDCWWGYERIGVALRELGRNDDAETYFRKAADRMKKAVELAPGRADLRRDLWWSHDRLGKLYVENGDWTNGLRCLRFGVENLGRAVELESDPSPSLKVLVDCCHQMADRCEEAERVTDALFFLRFLLERLEDADEQTEVRDRTADRIRSLHSSVMER